MSLFLTRDAACAIVQRRVWPSLGPRPFFRRERGPRDVPRRREGLVRMFTHARIFLKLAHAPRTTRIRRHIEIQEYISEKEKDNEL